MHSNNLKDIMLEGLGVVKNNAPDTNESEVGEGFFTRQFEGTDDTEKNKFLSRFIRVYIETMLKYVRKKSGVEDIPPDPEDSELVETLRQIDAVGINDVWEPPIFKCYKRGKVVATISSELFGEVLQVMLLKSGDKLDKIDDTDIEGTFLGAFKRDKDINDTIREWVTLYRKTGSGEDIPPFPLTTNLGIYNIK